MPVYKDNKGNWYIKLNNKTKRGFKTKREAEKYEAKMKLEESKDKTDIVFDVVAQDYLALKKCDTTFGTYSKYKKVYDNTISSMFPVEAKMKDITKMTCRVFYEKLSKSDLSTKTKNFVITEIKAIFKHGNYYFGVDENLASSLKRFKPTYEDMMKTKEKEMSIWTVEEFNKFISEIDNPMYKTFFIVLYYTGMRQGEVLALKWKDYIDKTFDVYKSVTYKTEKTLYEEKQTKNANSIRKVCVGDNIAHIIKEYKRREMGMPGFKNDWYIFGRNRPLALTSIQTQKNNACKKAEVKQIRIHDFRHSHASYLISKGVNVVQVSRRLGHADVNMTLKVYTHLFENDEGQIKELLDNSSQNLLNISV